MLRGLRAVWALPAAGLMMLAGCSREKPSPPRPPQGTLFTFIGDAPACDVLAFRANVTKLTMNVVGSTVDIGVIVSTPSFAPSIKVNFASLRDLSTLLHVSNLGVAKWDRATITLSAPEIVLYDPTQTPPVKTVTTKLTTSSPKISVQPPLETIKDQISGLRLDFDLLRSIEVDGSGQVTGNVTPVLEARPITATSGQGLGMVEDVIGFINRVDTFSANPDFKGDFQIQLLSGSGPTFLVNVKEGTTTLYGMITSLNDLNKLLTGSFVEVDGYIDPKGNFVGTNVEIEDQEVPEQNKLAFIGIITSVTKDSSGNVTSFDLYVRETEPDASFNVPQDSVVPVSVSPSTVFQFSSRSSNFASLTFDPTALTVGQEIIVHGVYTPQPAPPPPAPKPPPSVAADKVYLKLNSIQGNFSSAIQTGSDDKTGAFQFAPCGSIFSQTPIMVITNNQTQFVNVIGLSELSTLPTLVIQGLPFFEMNATTVNGVSVPAGTLVLLAKTVHQFL